MKLALNIFRISLLITLIFRIFFLKHFGYEVSRISYILLAVCVVGAVILEVYFRIKRKNL